MKATFIGHAGIFLEVGSVKLLCDPWLTKSGAFLASWHQFPRNDCLDPSLFKPTHLYISHKHQDHFDLPFLSTLDRDIRVILPKHPSGYLASRMHLLGFNDITLLGSWEDLDLSKSLKLSLVLDSVKYIEDSCAIIDIDGFKIFDLNDAKLNEESCRKVAKFGIDVMFSQFSGADYYPTVYQYGLDQKKILTDRFVQSLVEQFIARTSWVSPKVVVPSAGPACFLDKDLFRLNFDSIFPDSTAFRSRIAGKIGAEYRVLYPGEGFEIPSMRPTGQEFHQEIVDKEEYLRQYARDEAPIISRFMQELPEPSAFLYGLLKQRIEKIAGASEYLTKRVGALVKFEITGDLTFNLFADFRSGDLKIARISEDPAEYTFRIDSLFLEQIMRDEISFEDFLLSMRLSIERSPDVYNWPLFALLRFGYSPRLIKIIEDISKKAAETKIVVQIEGEKYEIQRYCSHAGEDLIRATIEGDVLTCPRHHWQFDVKSGKCLFGGNLPLETRKI